MFLCLSGGKNILRIVSHETNWKHILIAKTRYRKTYK